PQNIVIYEDDVTKEVGMMDLREFCSNHQHFGFQYAKREGWQQLASDNRVIPKDTVFLDSPAVTPNGGYMYGIEANVAQMSLSSTAEDGVIVSESFLKKLTYNVYERRVVEFGP